MTLQEFTRCAAAWGADIVRWPESLRTEAMRIAASAQGQAILATECRLDAILRDETPDIAPARIDRVIQRVVTALATEQPHPWREALPRWLIPTAGLACAVGIGALVATIGPLADAAPEDLHGVLTMIFDMNSLGQGFAL